MPKDNEMLNGASDIRVVTEIEAKKMSEGFVHLAHAMQVTFNAFQRNVAENIGLMGLYKEKKPTINLLSLNNGFSSKLASGGFATYPCLTIRKYLEDADAPKYAINFSTAFVDAAIRVPLDVNRSRKTLSLLGIDIAKKDLLKVSTKTFFPHFVRNYLTWTQINSLSHDNLITKSLSSAAAGAISTPLHNIGTLTMENAVGKSWEETAAAVLKAIKEQVVNENTGLVKKRSSAEIAKYLFRGAGSRSSSIGTASIILAPQTAEFLTKKCEEIFGDKIPSKSPKKPESEKLSNSMLTGKRSPD